VTERDDVAGPRPPRRTPSQPGRPPRPDGPLPPPATGYDDQTRRLRVPTGDQPPPQRWQQPVPRGQAHLPVPIGQQWPGPRPPNVAATPPGNWSYADAVGPTDLVPARKPRPGRGWRRFLHALTFGLVNLGPSPEELQEAALAATVRTVLRGPYKIGVLGKGGVGKTTAAAIVGSIFAELRDDDRVVAIDADTAFGKLGYRIDPHARMSYWELIDDEHLDTFADVRSHVGKNPAGLYVLPGEATGAARRRVLDPAIYREAARRLDRHFTISMIDCGSTLDAPVTQEVLRDLDSLLVVSSPWIDGATAAGQTMEWLADRGMMGLLHRTVVVLNDSDGHADKRTRTALIKQFTGRGQAVIEVPFDSQLRPGGVIGGTTDLAPQTRRRFLEVAATIAEHFKAATDGSRRT
jgi:MinD-like ATPase involved in chromosome partitioning or flagellar assembly